MKKDELYDEIMSRVSACSGLDKMDILHDKSEECSDARVALVQLLSSILSDSQIASLTGISRRGINYIRNTYIYKRNKWVVGSIMEEVGKYVGRIRLKDS